MDVLSGQTLARVIAAVKNLLQATGTSPDPVLQQFGPESQQLIRERFSS